MTNFDAIAASLLDAEERIAAWHEHVDEDEYFDDGDAIDYLEDERAEAESEEQDATDNAAHRGGESDRT